MLQITKLGRPGQKRWCAAIVVVAVCALTISVTTRYSFSAGTSDGTLTVVQKNLSLTPGVQRLLNNAATWIPPVAEAAIFHNPGYSAQVAQPSSPVLSVLLEKNLYNRPPPFLLSLS